MEFDSNYLHNQAGLLNKVIEYFGLDHRGSFALEDYSTENDTGHHRVIIIHGAVPHMLHDEMFCRGKKILWLFMCLRRSKELYSLVYILLGCISSIFIYR